MNSRGIIAVKFSEDLAQFADLRPVRQQPMTLSELVGLVLTTTGKDAARVRERLRGGTCTYNVYRYWWEALEVEEAALAAVLAEFPDPDPARPFQPEGCLWASLADDHQPKPHTLRIERAEAARRRWFRRESFWDFLLRLAQAGQLAYQDYSYYHRADLYALALGPEQRALLLTQAEQLARRALRERMLRVGNWTRLELACRR